MKVWGIFPGIFGFGRKQYCSMLGSTILYEECIEENFVLFSRQFCPPVEAEKALERSKQGGGKDGGSPYNHNSTNVVIIQTFFNVSCHRFLIECGRIHFEQVEC